MYIVFRACLLYCIFLIRYCDIVLNFIVFFLLSFVRLCVCHILIKGYLTWLWLAKLCSFKSFWQYQSVTDERTDGRTDGRTSLLYATALVKNTSGSATSVGLRNLVTIYLKPYGRATRGRVRAGPSFLLGTLSTRTKWWRATRLNNQPKWQYPAESWPWPWPWAHPGCRLTWGPSCASLVAIRSFACEKKRFIARTDTNRLTRDRHHATDTTYQEPKSQYPAESWELASRWFWHWTVTLTSQSNSQSVNPFIKNRKAKMVTNTCIVWLPDTSATRHFGTKNVVRDTSTRVPWSRKSRDTSTQDNSDETQLHRWFILNFSTNFVVPKCPRVSWCQGVLWPKCPAPHCTWCIYTM